MKKAIYIATMMAAFSLSFAVLGLARYSVNQHVSFPSPTEKTMIAHEDALPVWADKPVATVSFTKENPATVKPVLTWSDVDEAVVFELELGRVNAEGAFEPFYTTRQVYTNGYNVVLPEDYTDDVFYWRVRGLDLDGNAISDWSDVNEVHVDRTLPVVQKPILTSVYNQGRGTALLYPVYDWIPVNGAVKYELELLNEAPENPNGIEPSVHRVDSIVLDSAEHYDSKPRFSEDPFYWRVRGMDAEGKPVGVYSDAGTFRTNPADNYAVGTYGDSISHGGGSISYSPTDWNFSYQYYLNFESINLSQSGDTSAMTLERFDRDVLPFHPRYLIILMGSNSLRAGVSAEDVISDMKAVKAKCLANGILPVFLTLPPINPVNIQKAFDEPTADNWQDLFAEVNAYIRTQVHIDDAAGMADDNGNLPTRLALDGLHLDPPGKRLMAEAINNAWPDILALPESAWK